MIITQENNLLLSTASNAKKYSIEESAKMFQLLSANIYEFKIRAVVRELSCNADDSHTACGMTDVPIKVILPTELNPNLIVEDFGLGLSDDEVDSIYTIYGRSDKNDTNDLIGGLGIGSKSPFSYTSTFTLVAIKDGEENHYNMYMGDDGYPTYSKLATKQTDRGNGVKVIVPVRQSDIYRFSTEATAVFAWFPVKPELNKHLSYNIGSVILDDLEEHGFYADHSYHQEHKETISVSVIMGKVKYNTEIVLDELKGRFTDITTFQRYMKTINHLYVKKDIGEIDFMPSREKLSFTADSKKGFDDELLVLIEAGYIELLEEGEKKDNIIDCFSYYYDMNMTGRTPEDSFSYRGVTHTLKDKVAEFEELAVNSVMVYSPTARPRDRYHVVEFVNLRSLLFRHDRANHIIVNNSGKRIVQSVLSNWNKINFGHKSSYNFVLTDESDSVVDSVYDGLHSMYEIIQYEDIVAEVKQWRKNNKVTHGGYSKELSARYVSGDISSRYAVQVDTYDVDDIAYVVQANRDELEGPLGFDVVHSIKKIIPDLETVFIATKTNINRLKKAGVKPLEEYILQYKDDAELLDLIHQAKDAKTASGLTRDDCYTTFNDSEELAHTIWNTHVGGTYKDYASLSEFEDIKLITEELNIKYPDRIYSKLQTNRIDENFEFICTYLSSLGFDIQESSDYVAIGVDIMNTFKLKYPLLSFFHDSANLSDIVKNQIDQYITLVKNGDIT